MKGLPWASYQIYETAGCACAGNDGKVFPRRRLQRNWWLAFPACITARSVMHVGIVYLWWWGKRSQHSRRMHTRNLTYIARGPRKKVKYAQVYLQYIVYNTHKLLLHHVLSKWYPWWRHQMETFSALLALCAGNSPVPGEFPTQRLMTRSFDIYFDLRLNERLSKQTWGSWFQTPSCPLWRHCNVYLLVRMESCAWLLSGLLHWSNGKLDLVSVR